MPLKSVEISKAKPQDKQYKLYDAQGLFILVKPNGKKTWRFKYHFASKEKLLTIGQYPEVSLKEARSKRDTLRKAIEDGQDPSLAKKLQKQQIAQEHSNTFKTLAIEWYTEKHQKDVSASHAKRNFRRLELDVFPSIGTRAINLLIAPDILQLLKKIVDRGHIETAHRIKSIIGQIFRYAIGTHRADRDVTADLKGLLPSATKHQQHFPAIVEPQELGKLLKVLDVYHGHPITKAIINIAPLVFVRPNELRNMRWQDIDFSACQWCLTASKTNTPLIVPLAKQTIAIIEEIKPLTSESVFVFPSPRSNTRPLSEGAFKGLLDGLGYKGKMTAHGFRATARTLLDEKLEFPAYLIEQQLGHQVKDANGRAYNRTTHLEQRTKMMQDWADYLDELRR